MLTICFICLWVSMVLIFIVSVLQALKHGIGHLKRLHQIPCSKCEFFTNDYRLKCTVHPIKACNEEAINCFDFEAKTTITNINHRPWWKLRKLV